jgi:hypothetical protein
MPKTSWWQRALETAIHETNAVDDKIGLARLAILERLVSSGSTDLATEDTLLEALDTLRALDWERVSYRTEQLASSVG